MINKNIKHSYTFNDLILADKYFKQGKKWDFIARVVNGTPGGIRTYYNRHSPKLIKEQVKVDAESFKR